MVFPNTFINELTNLGPQEAVNLFRQLLWAEAGSIGLGISLINVPNCINESDGGIDAQINNTSTKSTGLIPIGVSAFQIKSSDLGPKECRKELHEGEDLSKPIKKEIKQLLDDGGTYCLVLFADLTVQKCNKRFEEILDELSKNGCTNPKVVLISANHLDGFIKSYYSLQAQIKPDLFRFIPFTNWNANEPKTFIADEQRTLFIKEIREGLRNQSNQALVYRVDGLPGIGKTRFVYEVLNEYDFSSRTAYFKDAATFLSDGFCERLLNDSQVTGIFVVDECSLESHKKICELFDRVAKQIAIFTLSYQIKDVSSPKVSLKPLEASHIEQILKSDFSQIPHQLTTRIAQFSGGYPRIVTLLARSYERDGNLSLKDEDLFKRLIAGDADYSQTEAVLTAYSLFEKVGYGTDVVQESQFLANYFNIPWDAFQRVVSEQRDRGILQGNNFLYVSPYILRVHLVRQWWKIKNWSVGEYFELIKSLEADNQKGLLKSVADHLKYLGHHDQGKELVREIISSYGSMKDFEDKFKADFFLSLSESNPDAALLCLENVFSTVTSKKLLDFKSGRRQIIYALNGIVIWASLFERGANIFLKLAGAENETWSNNATGEFSDLFIIHAPVEVTLKERSDYLLKLLSKTSDEVRKVLIRACDRALEASHFVINNSKFNYGLDRIPKDGRPKIYGEVFDYYRTIWNALVGLATSKDHDREKAFSVLLKRASSLSQYHNISEMIVEAFEHFLSHDFIDKRQIVRLAHDILSYAKENIPSELIPRWEKLLGCLDTGDYHSLLHRHVGMSLIDDIEYDENGNAIDHNRPQIKRLAETFCEDPEKFNAELAWLNSQDAINAYTFGYEVGKFDSENRCYSQIYDSQNPTHPKYNTGFLSGYLHAIFERDQKIWEAQIDIIFQNEHFSQHFSEIIWRSGLTQNAFLKVVDLVKRKIVPVTNLEVFRLGAVIKMVEERTFHNLITYLVNEPDAAFAQVAIELFVFYYPVNVKSGSVPKDITYELLTAKSFLRRSIKYIRSQQSTDYDWAKIADLYINLYPEKISQLSKFAIEAYCRGCTIFDNHHDQIHNVVCRLVSKDPDTAWKIISRYLGPPLTKESYNAAQLLQNLFHFIDKKVLYSWINKAASKRAWYISSHLPKDLSRNSITREFLIKYGRRIDVRRNLHSRFFTESWMGSESQHYQARIEEFEKVRAGETNRIVLSWLNEHLKSLHAYHKRAILDEERKGF